MRILEGDEWKHPKESAPTIPVLTRAQWQELADTARAEGAINQIEWGAITDALSEPNWQQPLLLLHSVKKLI